MEKKLVVVDGSSLLYRAFFGLPPLSYHGIPTNAVMGFLNMLFLLIRTSRLFVPKFIKSIKQRENRHLRNWSPSLR